MIAREVMRARSRRSLSESGFTLMEMLVVLVIIGLIAAVATPQIMKLLGSAKHKAAVIQLETVGQSLNHYSLDMGRYPTDKEGLAVLVAGQEDDPNWSGPYVRGEEQLRDPWGHALVYKAPGSATKGRMILRSLGADGVEGGTGDDRDVDYKH